MNKLKIGYLADGPWAHLAFEKIIENKEIEICFIVPRTDTKDNTLKEFSEKYNIDYLFPIRINSEEFIETLKKYECDLLVSMSFNQIFRKEILDIPKKGVINCHAGKLPFYRGRNVLNWVLINDEKEFGITVHFVDEGIDTGDIINQKTYPITDQDNYKSLLELAYLECANILYESLLLIKENKHKRINQSTIHPVGFYCGRRLDGDENINWDQTSREVFNFIRSICEPGPIATTFINGETVKINYSELITDAVEYVGTAGQILYKLDNGFVVKTKDSSILIKEIYSNINLKVGDKLGK